MQPCARRELEFVADIRTKAHARTGDKHTDFASEQATVALLNGKAPGPWMV